MIVPMKKVSLVVMDRDREASLARLRSLGVVHLERRPGASERLAKLMERKSRVENAAGLLRNYAAEEEGPSGGAAKKDGDLSDAVLELAEKRKVEQESLASDLKERSRIAPWGDFNPEDLAQLARNGLQLMPYELARKAYEKLGPDRQVLVLEAGKAQVRCLSVGGPLEGETPFSLPELSLSALESRIAERRDRLGKIEDALLRLARRRGELGADLSAVLSDIEFEAAAAAMDATADSPEGLGIAWLSGFVPASEAGLLKRAAADHGWALMVDEPSEADSPPTLVRNNALVRLVQPVFDLLGTVPGYREYDISLSFLLFFSLFFAMIFGDAGYGALLLALSLGFGFKAKRKSGKFPDGLLLIGLLSSVTVLWGAVNGTWFAIPYESLPPFLQALVIPPFRPDPSLSAKEAAKLVQQNVKHLCFIIGTFQLVLAHVKNIRKALPSLTALAQLGWLSMVVGLYFLVLNLVLNKEAFPVPPFAVWMIGGGVLTYFVFVEQKGGNVFKNILAGFANFLPTFLSAVSSFSDIISYIRLFAVGLAGYAIAESFNGMAAGIPGLAVRIFAGGLILVLGHGLNLAMSALSVVVHGVRLNMLEYSGHLGMEWSGVKYAPFALKSKRDAA